MQLKIYQVDAFSGFVFQGNPAAVCILDKTLPDFMLQAIASENNLSETAFIQKTDAGLNIRWFTPALEVDLCGHATLAAAHVFFNHLGYKEDVLEFSSRSGTLTVFRQKDTYCMNFPADQFSKVEVPVLLQQAFPVMPDECFRGSSDYLCIFPDEATVKNLQPDFKLIARLPVRGVIASAPGNKVDFVSRCFYPACGIDEDPVTGSAHTTMTPYWAKRLNKSSLTARQISKRGGDLTCALAEDRVELSGKAVTYMEGVIFV